ncbi:MAG TPA: hypothetical protein VHI95_17120 [Acidimicrobiales bacterium]|nr:hypothetical protein [Acidimicrobiales bacterium]
MDSAELNFLTRGLDIEADPTAGPRFRTAAVRLDDVDLDAEARRPVAADAARLLVGLALGSGGDELGELLKPDPAVPENRWTVACYEIGGLTPVAVRDFDDPVEAVVTVSACPDDAHVAAELVASNENGVRWTALWRTDDHISFQLPTTETAEAGEETEEGEHSEEVLGALRRWQARLDEWSGRDPTAPTDEPQPASTTSTAARVVPSTRPTDARLHALEQRLLGIESTLADLTTELQAFALDTERRDDASAETLEHAIDVRFQALTRVVQSALNRLGAQLVDEMHQLARTDTTEPASRVHDDDASNVIDMRGTTA